MEYNSSNWLVKDDENDLFYFESDHLALKGNKDYCEVLKTLMILTAQREKAIQDYNKVVEIRDKCLEDPIGTVEKIKNGERLGVPDLIDLPKLPVINFDKFDVKVSESDLKTIYSDHHEKVEDKNLKFKQNVNNKAWTPDEQKRLEELLMVYPPEPVEMRRFQKIANALGNRTVQQVTSRVQKYFIKLYKAGLPIPGRIPKQAERFKKMPAHKHQRLNHYLWKPTTFFPDLYIPVTMDEDQDMPGPSINTTSTIPTATTTTAAPAANMHNYLLATNYLSNQESLGKNDTELQLDLLKRVKTEKLKEQEFDSIRLFQHDGYKCDYCNVEPVIGCRWHCITCSSDSIDFCTDCVLAQMYSNSSHPLDHTLVVFSNDSEIPVLPSSGAESLISDSNKNFDSDSNGSGFDTNSNQDSFLQEDNNCDVKLKMEDCGFFTFDEENAQM